MAAVQGIHQCSWKSQIPASTLANSPLIELSNALNKLNYDANSFISNPDFISFLTKELASRYNTQDSKKVENVEVDKLKDKSFLNLRQNNQSYFDYALLQELLLSWNCYCTINIYPKLNSQEIQHNLVFDTCLGEKQIPDNVASFIKNLLDRGTDLDYIINLLMALQSGKNIDLSDIKPRKTPNKISQINNKINQQINNRKHVHFSTKLYEESNFESEKPILPPKKSTFKNPFKPLLQIKYKPFSKSPFRPTARPPPPPAPLPKTKEITSSKQSEEQTIIPSQSCEETNAKIENKDKVSINDQSNKENATESIEHFVKESSEVINFIDGEEIDRYPSSLKSTAKFVESIQSKVAMVNNDLMNNKNIKENENSKEKIYTVTKIQPMVINPITVNEPFDEPECLDSNNNSKLTLENDLDTISESEENYKTNNELADKDDAVPIAEMDPIYDLDIIDDFKTIHSTETMESVKRPLPPVPPPRKHRKSQILSESEASSECLPTISPTYARPHSISLPVRPIPPPRKHRSKHAHTLPKTKHSHQDILEQYSHATLPETSKGSPSHIPIAEIQPIAESECKVKLSLQSPPIPPPRRRRPTAPNHPFKEQIEVSDQGYHRKKFTKKKSLKEQFIKTTEVIKNKTRSAMAQIYNACKKIF